MGLISGERSAFMKRASKTGVLLATALLLVVWGCNDGGVPAVSGSSEETTVKGTVTIMGKPATSGTVVFDPGTINRRTAAVRRADVGKDGSYTVTTLVGDNIIRLEGKGMPRSFSKSVEVKSGGDTVNFEVKAGADTKKPGGVK